MLLRVFSTWISSSPSMDFGVYGRDCDDSGFVMVVLLWGFEFGVCGGAMGRWSALASDFENRVLEMVMYC